MSNKNLTEMVFILDASGSMTGLEQDTIGGFNSLIEKQKLEPGEALVSTVTFNERRHVLHDRTPIQSVQKLTHCHYVPAGCTALLDAIGFGIQHITAARKTTPKSMRPGKTVFVITTDGMENASSHFTYDDVAKLIKKKQKKGWEFLFLGANIDAINTAAKMHIDAKHAANYIADPQGTKLVYEDLNEGICAHRAGAPMSAWNERIEADAQTRGGVCY